MRRLVLLRHGLTVWNAEARWQGHADIELTETGHLQAKAAATVLAAYAPVRLLSSDLRRAAATAGHVADATGLAVAYDPRLREIHVGDFSGLTRPEAFERFGPGPYAYEAYGGESEDAVRERVLAVLRETADRLGEGETAILVGHGTSLKVGTRGFLGWPPATHAALGALDNCGWIVLEETTSSSSAEPMWRLAAYNRIAGDFLIPPPVR